MNGLLKPLAALALGLAVAGAADAGGQGRPKVVHGKQKARARPMLVQPALRIYYLALEGKAVGPFDRPALAGMVRTGALTRTTLVWRAGMQAWAAADTVPELNGLLSALPPAPPPLPGDATPPPPGQPKADPDDDDG